MEDFAKEGRNGLWELVYSSQWKDAQFSKPEYAKMIEIFYSHGFFNLGKEKNFDAMHWEVSA